MLGLARQQLRFSRRSPTITGQGAIFTHHPVAGNNHRQRIRRAGAGHGSYRPRLAQIGLGVLFLVLLVTTLRLRRVRE